MTNIKNIIITGLILLLSSVDLLANTDSLSFEAQRQKVNSLLDARASKFGEYGVSLEQKTGIFGMFKTKNDMQKSLNILQEIVKTDNNIFIETRNLLNIKDQQAEKHKELAAEYNNQVTAYMRTISKLQVTNENLKNDILTLKNEDHSDRKLFFIFTIIVIALLAIIFKQYMKIKGKKLTKL